MRYIIYIIYANEVELHKDGWYTHTTQKTPHPSKDPGERKTTNTVHGTCTGDPDAGRPGRVEVTQLLYIYCGNPKPQLSFGVQVAPSCG